jgi:hypothetical protein
VHEQENGIVIPDSVFTSEDMRSRWSTMIESGLQPTDLVLLAVERDGHPIDARVVSQAETIATLTSLGLGKEAVDDLEARFAAARKAGETLVVGAMVDAGFVVLDISSGMSTRGQA